MMMWGKTQRFILRLHACHLRPPQRQQLRAASKPELTPSAHSPPFLPLSTPALPEPYAEHLPPSSSSHLLQNEEQVARLPNLKKTVMAERRDRARCTG